jgi:hypothetical protein
MKTKLVVLIALLAIAAIAVPAVSALAITSDGNLNDWGLGALSGPSSNWDLNATWIPTNGGVEFLVADNDNPLHTGYPGFYAPGPHMIGTMNSWKFYDEPLGVLKSTGTPVNVPWGGKPYDIEAMYLAQDNDNIYVAIVTSMPQDGLLGNSSGDDVTPADLAMHFKTVSGSKYGFEYGVKLGTEKVPGNYNPGDIVYLPNWQDNGYILPVVPDVIDSALPGGGVVGHAQISYTDSWINHVDHGSNQHVIELTIPKADVGVDGNVALSNFLITQNCQNDRIFVPEFPTIAVSIGAILGLIFVIYVVRKKE